MVDDPSEKTARTQDRGRSLRGAWLEIALLLVGLGVVARILIEVGEGPIERIAELGGTALVIVAAPHLLAVLAITQSWWSVIPREPRTRVRFPRLVGAWLAGDALNYLLPAAGVGGEVTKVRLMRGQLHASDGAASVTIARVTDLFGLVAFGVLGTCCAVAVDSGMSDSILFGGLAGVTVLATAIAVLACRGVFGGAVGLLRRCGFRGTSARLSAAAERVDADVKVFMRTNPRGLVWSTAWRTAGWLVNVLELWIVLRLLGLHASVAELVAMEGLVALWNGALFFVPARVGTTEGGWLLVAGLFGFTSADALTIALLRRFRDTVWALVGLLMLAVLTARKGADE